MTSTMTRPRTKLAIEAVTIDAAASSMPCFQSKVPSVTVSMTAANTAAAKPTTIPWHWIRARLLVTIERQLLRVSKLPRLA